MKNITVVKIKENLIKIKDKLLKIKDKLLKIKDKLLKIKENLIFVLKVEKIKEGEWGVNTVSIHFGRRGINRQPMVRCCRLRIV